MDITFECPSELLMEKPGRNYRNIEKIIYHSTTSGTDRTANVVLPLNYSKDKKYPIMYVLHGFFGYEGTMLYEENSKIPEILGNMADTGLAKEVIAVYANIYVTADSNMAPGFSLESIEPYNRCIDDLINDLDPYMQANFSVLSGAENRAIVGFSMGGRQAIYIGLMRSDFAGYIVAVSPAPGLIYAKDWAMEHPGMFGRDKLKGQQPDIPLKLLMVCRGSKDSVVGKFPVDVHNALEENGVEHIWYEGPNMEHGEAIVQSAVYNLMTVWK